jgi:hypothetical protein
MGREEKERSMCFNKNIDDVLEQLKHCPDPKEKRRLLEEINPCKNCPEEKRALAPPGSCDCHQHYYIELKNIIEHIKQHPVDHKLLKSS